MLADGSVASPPAGDAERIQYLADNLFGEESAVHTKHVPALQTTPRVRFYFQDGTSAGPPSDPELAERIGYLAANLFPDRPRR
jgi:hypothetical protein